MEHEEMNDNSLIKVSILMPIFKVERYLARTLDSVFAQTYPNVEYVFVNDNSPDDSLQVLEASLVSHHIDKSRYTIINHDKNEGIAVSRADCLDHAKGDYVYFVDSDDLVEPDAVEQMVVATNGGKIDIVGCDYMKDFISGETTIHHENYATTCQENMIRCLNYDIATTLWKMLVKRRLFSNFSITPHVDIVEDYIITVKLFYYAKSFKALNRAFYHYVQYNQARVSLQTLWSVTMHIKGVAEVEAFLHEKGLFDQQTEHKLMLRKFNIKSNFLTKHLLDYEAYKSTFPEVGNIWREMDYSRKEKFKFWLAEHHMYFLLKLLQKCVWNKF